MKKINLKNILKKTFKKKSKKKSKKSKIKKYKKKVQKKITKKSLFISKKIDDKIKIEKKIDNLRIQKNRIYILNICYNCSVENIKQVFVSAKNIETVGPKTNDWKLIKISYD